MLSNCVMSGGGGASGGSAAGFFAGFALLIGTQLVVFGCGFVLWVRERRQSPPVAMAKLA